MDEAKETQLQVKKTPAFTVLKNGSILKNIFLLPKSSINQSPDEEVLLVGRHPDCNITLEHPSISRYHLRIHLNPSSHLLSIVGLSSVHGTWVSGKKVKPGVPVKMEEGDTLKMGGSSRVYELHWVPLSHAFDVNDPFVPSMFRKQEETQDESCSYLETHSSEEDLEKLNPLTCSTSNNLNSCCGDTEVEEHMSPSITDDQNSESFSTNHETIKDDPFSVPNPLESSIDVSIQTPPECMSETAIFDSINKPEDLSVAIFDAIETHEEDALHQDIGTENESVYHQKIDNMGYEFEQINQTKMTDESDSILLFTASEEVDMGVKFESVDDHETVKKESVFLALSNEERCYTPVVSRGKEVSRTHFDSLDGKELEFFTPDKENKDPNGCLMKSLRKRLMEDENKQQLNKSSTKLKESVNGGRKDILEKEAEKAIDSSNKKRWIMVLDTNTLLHNQSLKHLKLLQGLKGTQLFIPKTVIKELMDIKSQHDFLNITTKNASLALQWIQECMITTRWWIHMNEGIETVVETAIDLCQEIKDGKIIILSNDLSLKIKAMEQGIMCEEVEEFFRSLVNPYSDRFMWVGSLARGLTWSYSSDDVSNRFKGLKLLARINV